MVVRGGRYALAAFTLPVLRFVNRTLAVVGLFGNHVTLNGRGGRLFGRPFLLGCPRTYPQPF